MITFFPGLENNPCDFSVPEYSMDFKLTCVSVPEQYDVFISGMNVAYVRLRGGWLTIGRTPDPETEWLRVHWVKDKYKGEFESGIERAGAIVLAVLVIANHLDED